jgi:hypothetical protein
MAYLAVGDFKYGMDRRRPQAVGIPGTLWILKNAVLSRGGDIERAKKWVLTHTLPVNPSAPDNATVGLSVRNNQLVVFQWPAFTDDMPYDVEALPLPNPNGSDEEHVLTDVVAEIFDNKVYAIGSYENGDKYHFYNGARVTEWDDVAIDVVTIDGLTRRFAEMLNRDEAVETVARENKLILKAKVAGTAFTSSASVATGTAETAASGNLEVDTTGPSPTKAVTSVKVDGVELMAGPVSSIINVAAVLNAAVASINSGTASHGYTASYLSDMSGTFLLLAPPPGAGASVNGHAVTATVSGFTVILNDMAGGVDGTGVGSIDETIVQANVVAVAETRATGEVEITAGANGDQITSVTINGVELLDAPVNWLSNVSATANALVVAINTAANTAYLASAVDGVVTLLAAEGTGATVNGHVVAVTATLSATPTNVSGGVTEIEAEKQITVYSIEDIYLGNPVSWPTFTVTLNGVDYSASTLSAGMGNSIFVQKNRVWVTAGSTVQYCKLNTPTDWSDTDASAGSGFINIGNAAAGAQYLYGIEEYNGRAAIFAESTVVIYQLFADAQQINFEQSLQNTGTVSAGAVRAYGADDVFYLDKTGIRSLRSRDGYDAAFASDIGSAIDPFVKELVREVTSQQRVKAQSVVETDDGRFMMALGQYIVTLSYFPASKITAWSYMDFGQPIDNMVRCGDRVVLRTGNELYTYGGEDGDEYPEDGEFNGIAETPFMSASDPATKKFLQSYDHIAEGEWLVEVLPNPKDRTVSEVLGRFTSITNNDLTATLSQYTSLFALRYTCDKAGFASLSAIATHFEKGEKN